jgi:hypothetical protein
LLVLAACGGSSDGAQPAEATEVVLRVVTRGGFAAESRQAAQLPQLSVFGDGRVIIRGPTTLEFPGPALPNLQEFRLTRDGLANIVDEVRNLGLLDDPPPDFGDPGITDQPTTTVTVSLDGRTRHVDVHALGFTDGLTDQQRQNRDRLNELIQRAGDADAQVALVVPGTTRRYEPNALAVLIRPSDTSDSETRDWPLGDLAGAQCAAFRSSDLVAVLDAARNAEDVRWFSAGESYRLVFRRLLPDEKGCDDLR